MKKQTAWKVAVAILILKKTKIDYRELTVLVLKTRLSTLTEESKKNKPEDTLLRKLTKMSPGSLYAKYNAPYFELNTAQIDLTEFTDLVNQCAIALNEPVPQSDLTTIDAVNEEAEPYSSLPASQYWLYAPGEGARHWEEFYSQGIIGLGWDDIGNLDDYATKNDILKKLQEVYPEKNKPTNSALALYDFKYTFAIGDMVIAKKGSSQYIGCGVVISDYFYDESRLYFKNCRKIKWLKRGVWEGTKGDITQKTLTNITTLKDYVREIKLLMGISENAIYGDDINVAHIELNANNAPNYWWLNANPDIWKISDMAIGDMQTYTARNENGYKRRIYKYFEEIKQNDLIIGYESTPIKAIKGIFRLTKELHNNGDQDVIEFEMIQKVNPPVSWEELKKTKELGECEVFRNNQGSLFRMKQDEYEIIMDMIAFKMESPSARVLAYDFDTDPDKPFIEATEFKELCQLLLKKKNIILQGAAGVGKTFLAKKMAYQILKEQNDAVIEMVQFHQSYSYEDFVQGLRPDTSGNFVLTNGVFYSFCKKAAHQPTLPFFFIIDEINRGNLSKILGELMLLIEHDKRKSAYALKLTYAENDQDKFYVPENVHIIGTMNTADRSLAMIDYALRRRFAFADITPCFDANFSDFLNKNNISEEVSTHIVDCIQKVNQYIANDDALGKGFLIGHSYFTNFDENKTNWEWWSDIIRYELKPLFEEIWFDSPQKITEMLSILAPKKQ